MKRIALIILLSVCIVVSFTAAKYAVLAKSLPNANFGIMAINHRYEVDDLYIGSSMFRNGINSSDLGSKTFLLSYNGNQPIFEALQVKQVIRKQAPIKRVIVDMYAFSICADAGLFDPRIFMDGDIPYSVQVYKEMKKTGRNIGLLYEMVCQGNNELFVTWPVSYPLINARYDKGAGISYKAGTTANDLEQQDIFYTESRHLNQYQSEGIVKLVKECNEAGLEVIFVETPKYYRLYSDDIYVSLMQEYIDLLKSIDVRMIVSDMTLNATDRAFLMDNDSTNIKTFSFDYTNPVYFTDAIHLSTDGRDSFTETLRPLLY